METFCYMKLPVRHH
ncbi:hypothetical protein R4R77_000487 [Citrobacter amalonaticus]|nr:MULTISPECIES: hypothetical protein [Citrobacter]EKW3841142.1 hypothetical protein [Citrobacter amalonaticus]EKW5055819.1 hypothetical protein [Citrobacter amalonaticus]EKW5094101.1 hypothetical protein [Citrobacter amalonaticus]EKX8493367.1 hypothetical protein [Citrobacter amalonaticus]EKY5004997.1 hypothetical protein [Citrobacter amalonaticus]